MRDGGQRIDAGTLGHGVTNLRRLATHANAPETIHRDIEAWNRAVIAHSQSLTSWQPTFSNGRFTEPDTSVIDRTLIDTVMPPAERIAAWVRSVCGN